MGRFEFQGYSFDTAKEMDFAIKEAESVKYIKAKTELKDREKARKLYESLVEKNTFVTPIGINFMIELQKEVSMFSTKPIPGVPVHLAFNRTIKREEKMDKNSVDKLSEVYKNKLKNLRIVNLFLILLVVAMFAVVIFGDNSPYIDVEQKIQDKYATWEKELREKEDLLNEKEQQLNQN